MAALRAVGAASRRDLLDASLMEANSRYDGLMRECTSAATIYLGYVREQEAGLPRLLPGIRVGPVLLAPFGLAWEEFSL